VCNQQILELKEHMTRCSIQDETLNSTIQTQLKGTVIGIIIYLPFKKGHTRFTTVFNISTIFLQ